MVMVLKIDKILLMVVRMIIELGRFIDIVELMLVGKLLLFYMFISEIC